jgi:hypothetical protein
VLAVLPAVECTDVIAQAWPQFQVDARNWSIITSAEITHLIAAPRPEIYPLPNWDLKSLLAGQSSDVKSLESSHSSDSLRKLGRKTV